MPNPIRLLHPTDDLQQAIDDFTVRLRAQGRSEHTISAYMRDLRCFGRALPAARVAGVTPRNLVDCLIANVALRNDAELLAADRDFEQIASVVPLRLYRP